MSPKTQQDGRESVHSSRSSSLSKASRKARRDRDRDRDRTDKKKEDIEAGPSGTSHSDAATEAGPSTTLNERQDVASSSFAADQDFVGFTFSDDEKENEEEVEETAPPVREWDRGKGKARDYEGRKRRHDEIDYNDGYANKKQRLDAASRLAPWAVDVEWDKCTNVAEMLHQEVEAFVKYISPTPVEDEVRSLIVASISRAVTGAVSDAKVFPFGSYETKLYLPLGDIDLVVESDRMAYSNKTHVLQKLAAAVKHAGITDKVTIIAKAKVPIIKFITRHGRFSVDMSINQMNGVKAGTMVKGFLDHLPALRALVLITKSFLSQRSMNEVFTGGLGSYSIVCLAISFLQMHPKIRRGEIDPSKNLGVLVMEFFELYGFYFNYNEVGISVRDGGSYYNKSQRGWSDYRSPGLLSVEDPGDPSNDISRGSYGIAKVRATLAGAHGIMTAAAYAQAGIINSRRGGRHGKPKKETNPEEMSILASVMGVTMEVCKSSGAPEAQRLQPNALDYKSPQSCPGGLRHPRPTSLTRRRSPSHRHSQQ
ncbi:hypothetical protein PHLGIDRAFT_68903 [Phlebiopsis gigantea 11061_1 CR5-6]|uniref:polynucleotide adenylyltransferase n=1 Tax=Phlebiopsis gigantea (strain 11061_1 CR5-6) TaxID=745531 RepID=A0A0C3S9Z6_PHLG1|nr:hypothetical protein PHLGIDRAFT_68903 [Phlebiopsis gigantea 11061_1 CR5-6]